MSKLILRLCLYFVGGAGVLIGASFIVFGVDATAQVFKALFDLVVDCGELSSLRNANADSELSFYSVFWIAYGVLMIKAAHDVNRYHARIPWLIGLFFAGGLVRAVSYIRAPDPHALFILLMIIELSLPVLMIIDYRLYSKRARVAD